MRTLDQSRLRRIEAMCTQEQPPAAMAMCPLHVDCKEVCRTAAANDMGGARAAYEKSVPFPGILSCVCEAPCKKACVRKNLGGAINMRSIEKAAVKYGKATSRRAFLPRRNDRVCVVGGGVCGLTAALELAKKGCKVTVLHGGDTLFPELRARPDLPDATIQDDLKILGAYPIEIKLGAAIDDTSQLSDFDAVFYADGSDHGAIDEYLYTNSENVFCARGEKSVIGAMAEGRRAAISIDRYLKKVSLSFGREFEGAFNTTLVADTDGIEPVAPSLYDEDELDASSAANEAKRCIQCTCLRCVKNCAFLTKYKAYPKKYVREIYNNLSIAMGNRTGNTMINSCSMCGRCKAVCPNGMDMGAVIENARYIMVQGEKMPQSTFEFAVDDMDYSNSDMAYLAKNQPGFDTSAYVFMPGCQLGASVPELVKKTYKDLTTRIEGGVGLLLNCCGVIAKWAGDENKFKRSLENIEAAWKELGRPTVITACPTCFKTMREGLPDIPCVGIWDVYNEIGLPYEAKTGGGALSVHDACGARNQPEVKAAVRELVEKLGYTTSSDAPQGESVCCGFGGLTQYANPELANATTRISIREGDKKLLSYCMNCRDRFTKEGANSVHLLELVFGDEGHMPPTYSKRRDNREELKRSILKEMWNEEKAPPRLTFRLMYSDELNKLLEKRLILEQDIREVVDYAESTNCKLIHAETGLYVAHMALKNITFWVYYRPIEDGFLVERAYSHRMTIKGD